MFIRFDSPARSRNPLSRIFTTIAGVLVLCAALMFSLVFFAVIAVGGLLFWLYFWWKSRKLRRLMSEHPFGQTADFGQPAADVDEPGCVIEGEATRVVDENYRLPR